MKKALLPFLLLLPAAAAAAEPEAEIFPNAAGASWSYRGRTSSTHYASESFQFALTNLPPRELAGEEVLPRRMDVGDHSEVAFVARRDGMLCDLGAQGAADPEPTLRPAALCFLPLEPRPGASWKAQSKLSQLGEGQPLTLELRVEAIDEVVTVPAGTFSDCVKISARGTAELTLDEPAPGTRAVVTAEKANWYAPGVGLVRIMIRENGDHPQLGAAEMIIELERYQPAP